MFKKRKLNKRTRLTDDVESKNKRQRLDDDNEKSASSSDDEPQLDLKKDKKPKFSGSIQASTVDEKDRKMKVWQEKNKALTNSGQEFKATRELTQSFLHYDDDDPNEVNNKPNQEVFEQELKRIEITNGIKNGTLDPSVYRGQKGYATYFDQTEELLKKKQFNGTLGPTKNDNYMRSTSRIDRNPELCKDYFETGHCAFGDTCIFIHDRSDYASGHQIEEDWNNQQRKLHRKLLGNKHKDDTDSEDEGNISAKIEEIDDEGLPLKCKICNLYLNEPIITNCGHYFCEDCAMKHHQTDKTCFTCKRPTQGIFNIASKITKKLSKMSKSELESYRKKHSLEDTTPIAGDDTNRPKSTACCSHSHSHDHKCKAKKFETEEEEDAEIMKEYLAVQSKIKENNMKATAGGWVIP